MFSLEIKNQDLEVNMSNLLLFSLRMLAAIHSRLSAKQLDLHDPKIRLMQGPYIVPAHSMRKAT